MIIPISSLNIFSEIIKKDGFKILFTSGGFDPVHTGHCKLLLEAKWLRETINKKCILIVAVNDDPFLINKKGYVTLPAKTRISVIDAIKDVDYTFLWYDNTQTVACAIDKLRPHYFLKGGDVTKDNFNEEERLACERTGCIVLFGVGGEKIQSSSKLCPRPQPKTYQEALKRCEEWAMTDEELEQLMK